MIRENQYVPILKGKVGEFTALQKLAENLLDDIVPVIDLVPNNQKELDDHMNSILKYFNKWDKTRLVYIDAYMLDDSGLLSNNTHPLQFLYNQLIENEFNFLPVLNDVICTDHKNIVKDYIEKIGKGTAIRFFIKPVDQINTRIDELLDYLNLQPNQIDLIIDLRSTIEGGLKCETDFLINFFENLRHLDSWRSLVLAGGNFPIDLTELAAERVHRINRTVWSIWKTILQFGKLERNPTLADYAISHPSLSEFEGDVPNASASIRYTHEENYYVYRGRGTKQYGYQQFFDISESLVNGDHYYGEDHCLGDKFIHECAIIKEKTGNLTTWRWVGTVHHITVVVNQLRQFLRTLRT